MLVEAPKSFHHILHSACRSDTIVTHSFLVAFFLLTSPPSPPSPPMYSESVCRGQKKHKKKGAGEDESSNIWSAHSDGGRRTSSNPPNKLRNHLKPNETSVFGANMADTLTHPGSNRKWDCWVVCRKSHFSHWLRHQEQPLKSEPTHPVWLLLWTRCDAALMHKLSRGALLTAAISEQR